MNVIQGGPTPIVVAAAAEVAPRPLEKRQPATVVKPVKASAKGEAAETYAAHKSGDDNRGQRVDKEA